MRLTFRDATPDDAPEIAALQNAASGALTIRFGEGRWSAVFTERRVVGGLLGARVRLGRSGKRLLTVLRLTAKKPWAIDVSYFTAAPRPLYLTDMAVAVAHQRHGLGRLALADACAVARGVGAGAIRLDAYDADAGAGGFYARSGYQERGRVVYRGTPLVYYELVLGSGEGGVGS